MNILKIDNVSFSYDKEKLVLKNINANFKTGIIYGIFGRSGAGKTTLLSLLAGLETPSSGIISYKDQDISKINNDKYRSTNMGIVFQSFNLLPHLTALENVILSMNISNIKINDKEKKALALTLLKKVGLDETKAKRKVLQLSGGEQQRVSIARALSYDAEIILADEPTGNLDRDTEEDIINLLTKLAHEENKCVIIISHSEYVKKASDKVYFLANGNLKEAQ